MNIGNKMTFKCAHISDIHWRSLKRHEEYKNIFEKLFISLRKESPNIIFIGGDIVHSKTQGITPELIDNLTWMFNKLTKISDVHVILGNHDGLILNKDRQDAITPIINALNNPKIKLYKKSGVYPLFKAINGQMINWCVFSCFDEENWSKVKPVKNEINIACFHGAVRGSKTDIDWELEGEVNLSFFDDYDFAFLGDIHKKQYLDRDKRIAYPGSLIQQNYGEDVIKGYLMWEINSLFDFNSKFIKIKNDQPYVTVDWKDSIEETIRYCEKVKNRSRFRIRSKYEISQAEIKIIHHYLKYEKNASEITYQVLNKISDNFSFEKASNNSFNIRNHLERENLIKTLYPEISDLEFNNLNNLFKNKIDEIPETLSRTKNKWEINSLKFDNTFSYGKDNFINFDNLSGVVGLFGNNRIGKSSIPGTLMYSLFNTSDRGSLKNQDIVNIRKGQCNATVEITVNDKKYKATRKTIKKTNKKGEVSALTTLSLLRKDNEVDKTEEQRRETDKVLRDLIGESEDFLYTSFASQGKINTFINEKSSARKAVLSNFLKLEIFDELYKNSREDYIVLKNKLKSLKEENWQNIIEEITEEIQEINNNIQTNNNILSSFRKDIVALNVELYNFEKSIKTHSSGLDLETCNKELKYYKDKIVNHDSLLKDLHNKLESLQSQKQKIKSFKDAYPISDLESDKEKLDNLSEDLKTLKYEKRTLLTDKNLKDNEIKILDQVPCEDKFPNCRFIKKAFEAKQNINAIEKDIENIELTIFEVNNIVKKLANQEVNQKIKKYHEVLNKEYKINIDIERTKEKIGLENSLLKEAKEKTNRYTEIYLEIEKLNNDDTIKLTKGLKTEINRLQNEIITIESDIKSKEIQKFKLQTEISNTENRKKEYENLISEWKTYDLFTLAVSKKGIPAMIINSCLPKINAEINKILSNVSSFKIDISEDFQNGNLNVYIDYGDSKRIIECASGMEKMISSIAIRVALINISSLPKSNIFIIDEGFGSLDNSNVEACSRLLKSLKKYFKTILIISHVDEIKDIVDKNIEITLKGKDSYVRYE